MACVNRLAQFTTEQIEDFGYDLFAEDRPRLVEAQNEIHLLKKQRDELISDIERTYKMLLSEPDTQGALFKAENILREALASVKGEQP